MDPINFRCMVPKVKIIGKYWCAGMVCYTLPLLILLYIIDWKTSYRQDLRVQAGVFSQVRFPWTLPEVARSWRNITSTYCLQGCHCLSSVRHLLFRFFRKRRTKLVHVCNSYQVCVFGSTLVSTKMTILATARLLCNHWTLFKVALTLSFKSIICGYFCFGGFFMGGGGAELVWMYFCLGKYQLHVNQSPCMLQRCSSGLQLFYTRLCDFSVPETD